MRLNNISTRLITMKVSRNVVGAGKKDVIVVEGTNPVLRRTAAIAAIRKLLPGPARETHINAERECARSFHGFTGTGFAQPNPMRISIKLPIRSRCLNGFKVNRPAFLGVSSPKRSATKACENSWIVSAIRRVTILEIRTEGERLSIQPASPETLVSNHFGIISSVIMRSCFQTSKLVM